ncbi:MAG: RrF2 family transcriptional regulator [Nocardioides sp.]
MRVSTKADYALRALIEMTLRADRAAGDSDTVIVSGVAIGADTTASSADRISAESEAVSAEELGRAQDIPRGFLQAILADLRRADLVVSQRGQRGGWRLLRAPEEISVADTIRAVDGPLVSVYGLRPEAVTYNESAQSLQHVWIAARHALRDVFEDVSIRHLANQQLPETVAARAADRGAWEPH